MSDAAERLDTRKETAPPAPPPAGRTDRVIRVFISSTFRDMMRERDLLVKRVFPELRRICVQRLVTFTEVDLRWGINEEQAAEGQVLPLCLAEIERSRPYFIGLLGERYGWIPDAIHPDVIEREPWLKEHVRDGTSVTELEILHGVLNNPGMAGHACFFFRDPAYVNSPAVSAEERFNLVEQDQPDEIAAYGATEAARRTAARRAKLAALKQRIRDSHLPLVEPYADPEALADEVRQQFVALIDRLFPADQTPDPLTRERLAHEAHAQSKRFGCIARPAHLAVLDAFADHADHGGRGLVITGESGGGKTALLAAWAYRWARSNPDDFLLQHYFGATAESASAEGFLRRLLGELKLRFGIAADVPEDPGKLRDLLPLWLAEIPSHVQSVLVLDGINQIQGDEAERRLSFLPAVFPPHITAIASALSGPALATLHERGWVEHELPPAQESEVEAMLGAYLTEYRKTLAPDLRRAIVHASGARNPLFLRTVLEELRQFGGFEQLPARVAHYLEAHTPQELFLRVIRRWQEDFDHPGPDGRARDLVRRALTHLWAARQGLSESEWLDLLGTGTAPLPRAHWTPFFLALEPHLSQRTGLLAFGHDFLRQAVETGFLGDATARKAAHLNLADYFETHPHQAAMSPRKAAEWPYQLHAAEAWDRLEACLTDLPLFLALCNDQTKWELTGYWHPLRRRGRDMGACYEKAYRQWSKSTHIRADGSVPTQLGQFLSANALYAQAQPLLRHALSVRERTLGAEHPDTIAATNNLAVLFFNMGNYPEARPLYQQGLRVSREVFGSDHPMTLRVANNWAAFLYQTGDYTAAIPLLKLVLEARMKILGDRHPDTLVSMSNLAVLWARTGNFAEARQLFEQALAGHESRLGPEHPTTLETTMNLARVVAIMDGQAVARKLFERSLQGYERTIGPEHPDTLACVNSLAGCFDSEGDYPRALSLYRRALEGRERRLGSDHPDTVMSMNDLAASLFNSGNYEDAQSLLEHAISSDERKLGPDHPDTLLHVGNLAAVLDSKGDYQAALPLYSRALDGRMKTLGPNHPLTLKNRQNLEQLLEKMNAPDDSQM